MILGIDASSPGSGGGKRHLIELLKAFNNRIHHFDKIKVWGVQSTLDQIPENENIIKISPTLLNGGFFKRVIWQIFFRDNQIGNNCDILFCPFGTYSGNIKPFVSMSRNMLIFDKNERRRFGLSWIRLKLKILFYLQKKSFSKSSGIIFLSQHAYTTISSIKDLSHVMFKIIPHGVAEDFNSTPSKQRDISCYDQNNPFKLLYVSSVWIYKHFPTLVRAVNNLWEQGYPINLKLVGSPDQKSESEKLKNLIMQVNVSKSIVSWDEKVSLNEINKFYRFSDAFVFSSTCENMPNILVEAMKAGLPIACSSFNPMPEFLKDAGFYFNPTDINDVEKVLKEMINNPQLREERAKLSYNYSKEFTWSKCANSTFNFLNETVKK
jgi:glycosyltransferase involved in cell wall biosynthesis